MLLGIPRSARCVQRFDDSLNSAIHITYRISLRSSSMREPRDPLLKVVYDYYRYIDPLITFCNIRRGIWIHSTQGYASHLRRAVCVSALSISHIRSSRSHPIVDCFQPPRLQKVHRWMNRVKTSVHMPRRASYNSSRIFNNDPSAGSPTETLLRLLLPLNDQVWSASQQSSAVAGSQKPIRRPH